MTREQVRRKAEARVLAAAKARGFTVLGQYLKNNVPLEMRCPKGHECSPTPNNFTNKSKPAGCLTCSLLVRGKKKI